MSLSVGIVGLPNVGKSTLFNALLKRQQALAANYPFATIEPNTGIVEVPDTRLHELANVVANENSKFETRNPKQIQNSNIQIQNQDKWPPIKPATIEFVDIAGLVAGASKGEGLGNQFLANIRETDLICHVMRAFDDSDVVITGAMNPIEDLETIRIELSIKDLETLNKKIQSSKSEIRNNIKLQNVLNKATQTLSDGKMLGSSLDSEELALIADLQLLTAKPEIFVINTSEEKLKDSEQIMKEYADLLKTDPENIVVVSAKIEAEIASLPEEEQPIFLEELGLTTSGIERMAQVAYGKLDLISFLTAGEIEVKAWTITKGTKAPDAAGVIHTDFTKKFIKAEVIDWQDFVELSGWKKARELGKVRLEGKDYVMRDGDVVDFKIGG